jgi:hypothetical protein
MAAVDVLVGNRFADHVLIRILSRTDQVIRDYWDANWLNIVFWARAGGWKGKNAKAYFRSEELARFREQLEKVGSNLLLEAEFAPMEPHLRLKVRREEGGDAFLASGTATDRIEGGNTLSFRFPLTRPELAALIDALKAAESAFPTICRV